MSSESDHSELSADARGLLAAEGWSPRQDRRDYAREVLAEIAADGFSVVPGLESALAHFGGVTVQPEGPGIEVGRMSIEFDARLALGEADRFSEFEEAMGISLSPLGEVEGGMAFLALGSDGGLYFLFQDAWRAGQSLEQGIDAIITGRASSKLDV